MGDLHVENYGLWRDAEEFWDRLTGLPDERDLPEEPRALLLRSTPDAASDGRVRVAGLGSLGRTRATLTARWRGGLVAREVKRVLPPAWTWTSSAGAVQEVRYAQVVGQAVRCPDPFLHVEGAWVVRRLAPDDTRVELDTLRHGRRLRLLEAMGAEAANVHLGSRQARGPVVADLARRPCGWLARAASVMVDDVTHRQRAWHRRQRAGPHGQHGQ